MDLFTSWFNKILPSDKLRQQCPFVDEFKAEYVNCFHNVYKVQEFDWRRYLNDHPNVKKKGAKDELTTYHMWILGHRKNGFVIGTDKVYEGFPWNDYLKRNSGLGKHGIRSEMEAYQHWTKHGRKEKRVVKYEMGLISEKVRDVFINKLMQSCVTETVHIKEFDWKRYLEKYPDLVKAGYSGEKRAYEHWALCGRNEGRTVHVLGSPTYYTQGFPWNQGFPWINYLAKNPDLKHLNTELQCYNHWVDFGRNEKRNPWKIEYSGVRESKIFKCDASNRHFLQKMKDYVQYNVYERGKSVANMETEMINALNHTTPTIAFDAGPIDNQTLTMIYKNIDKFSEFIRPYKNILFICSDYPCYGGAATNCENLSKFYSKTHNTETIYWTYTNDKVCSNTQNIVSQSQLESTLKKLTFKPDLIILKNSIACDLTKIFKCPTIFLIPGIYTNELDVHYTKLDTIEKQNKYINPSTLTQIHKSTYSFCNSSHTQDILKKWYGLNTVIFCSTFIQFYGQTIPDVPDFHNRKYDYGLVISDFTRKIKNVETSIDFLKDKKNVILIGGGSSKYKSYGFDTIEIVDTSEVNKKYKQIKYIVQDSFYESCSNVKIEGLFNGCKIKSKYSGLNVVVSSTQYPGYGGAATNAYQIIKHLRQNGVNTVGVFFHDVLNINYNPDNLEGILLYLYNDFDPDQIRIDVKTYLKAEPNYCLAKNYIAPYICKNTFNCYTVYLVSGIRHFNSYRDKSAEDILNPNFIISKDIPDEIQCNTICDKIVLNSNLSYDIFNKIYPQFRNKISPTIIDTSQYINTQSNYNNNSKEFDIIIVCSRLDRVEKNNLFLINILKKPIFNNHRKIIIGSNFDKFVNIPNAQCVGLCDQITCIEYMAKSKVLLFPSLFDANSNTIREAIYNKCLPLITKNIGFYEAFPDCLICKSYSADEWSRKLLYILENYSDLKDTKFNFNTSKNIIDIMDLL